MSKYTTEVRFICEHSAGLTESVGYNSIDNVLDSCRNKIFDFYFPIFDENYRTTLENKILKHYYTREICCETVGLWKHFLCTKLNEIMPYYNQLYRSALIEFNPLYDVDITIDHQKVDNGKNDKNRSVTEDETATQTDAYTESTNATSTKNGNSTSNDSAHSLTSNTNTNKNDHWEYFSDTPEGGINGVADLSYLTNATHITDDGTGSTSSSEVTATNTNTTTKTETSNGNTSKASNNTKNLTDNKGLSETTNETIKNVEDYLEHVVGKRGSISYSKMLDEYRKTFINIDMMVINDLRDLFINLW